MNKAIILILAGMLAGVIRAEPTLDAVSVGGGQSTDHIDVLRVGARSDFGTSWFDDRVSGFFEASANYWRKNDRDVWCGALSPVFTYTPGFMIGACKPYLAGGIGVAAISETKITKDRNMASVFQFEDRIGIGLKWRDLDFTLGLMHYSNGDTSRPNQGINIHILTVAYRF